MTIKNARRLKAAAQAAPQTREECATAIARLGELQRQAKRLELAMNDEIAAITQRAQPELDELKARIDAERGAVQAWCEANRIELTSGGKTKTANLVTGEVSWRQRPPKCLVRGEETVIETLERLGLERFVRNIQQVNKEAVLADPEAVRGVAGLSIQTGVEDFIVTPFEQEVAE